MPDSNLVFWATCRGNLESRFSEFAVDIVGMSTWNIEKGLSYGSPWQMPNMAKLFETNPC